MNIKRVILLITLLIFCSNFTNAEDNWSKEDAIKLLEPDWEYSGQKLAQPMIFYFIKIEELDNNLTRELEVKLSHGDLLEDKEWQLIGNNELINSIWDQDSIEISIYSDSTMNSNDYQSWLVTVPGKEAEIDINSKIIDNKSAEIFNYFSIIVRPIQISENKEKVLSYLLFQNKDNYGNISEIETSIWVEKINKKPVVLLKQKEKTEKKERNKYFALYIRAEYIYPEMLAMTEDILLLNNIKGINDFLQNNKPFISSSRYSLYFNGDDGGVEYIRNTKDSRTNLSLFSRDDDLNYQLYFNRDITLTDGLSASVLLRDKYDESLNPYIFIGIGDDITYLKRLKWGLTYYPLVYSVENPQFSTGAGELSLVYQINRCELAYKSFYWDGEFENRLDFNYDISSEFAISTMWEKISDDDIYYIGFTIKK